MLSQVAVTKKQSNSWKRRRLLKIKYFFCNRSCIYQRHWHLNGVWKKCYVQSHIVFRASIMQGAKIMVNYYPIARPPWTVREDQSTGTEEDSTTGTRLEYLRFGLRRWRRRSDEWILHKLIWSHKASISGTLAGNPLSSVQLPVDSRVATQKTGHHRPNFLESQAIVHKGRGSSAIDKTNNKTRTSNIDKLWRQPANLLAPSWFNRTPKKYDTILPW